MGIHIEVKKNQNETTASLVRRFTKRVQASQFLKKARSKRYKERKPSSLRIKQNALGRLAWRKEKEHLYKLGKDVYPVRSRTPR